MKEVKAPTLKAGLKSLILDALKLTYTSVSCKDSIETGNHYQSVALGDEQTTGFRSDRATFLDQIDFRGKRVLDLGSNLGEMSRAARLRGAALVDGYEYDAFFVEVAEAINAYNGTTRVSFYERDITSPGTYTEHYDVVLAFSVFTYLSGVLDQLSQITDEALVVETHKLDGNLERGYLAPVRRFLPAYEILGESDWGRALPEHEARAVIVFGRDQTALDRVLRKRVATRQRATKLDVQRTGLQSRFFARVKFTTGEGLLETVRRMDIQLAKVADDPDLATTPYSGQTYWLIFLKGYCQYLDTGVLGRGNVYYDYILDYYGPRGHDPGVSGALTDGLFALERVAARFKDLDRFRRAPKAYVPDRVTLFQSDEGASNHLILHELDIGEPVRASAVDGWHRLFAARVFGASSIDADVITPSQ